MNPRDCKNISTLIAARKTNLRTADRIRIEEHLSGCATCAEEARMQAALVALMDSAPPVLSGSERADVIFRALSASDKRAQAPSAGRWPRRAVGAGLLAAAGALLGVLGGNMLKSTSEHTVALSPRTVMASQPRAEESDRLTYGVVLSSGQPLELGSSITPAEVLEVQEPADLRLAHANVHAEAGTRLRWRREERTVELVDGSVTATVDPAPHARFAVETRDFRVVVTGTQFRVTPTGVSVTEGSVRVETIGGKVLQPAVHAGQRFEWKAAEADELPPDTNTADVHPASELPAGALLSRARMALARRRLERAEHLIERALAQHPNATEKAEALTLRAESAATAGNLGEAVRRHLQVARTFPGSAAGQNALYAAAQLQVERGHEDAARALLLRYLKEYPRGHFVREARRSLAQVSHAGSSEASPQP